MKKGRIVLFWLLVAISAAIIGGWMNYIAFPLNRSKPKTERDYQAKWCAAQNGRAEVVLKDRTRVDCLTETHAIEIDFAGKWEAPIQALHYARLTKKRAGIMIICRKKGDRRRFNRLRENIIFYKFLVDIWSVNCEN